MSSRPSQSVVTRNMQPLQGQTALHSAAAQDSKKSSDYRSEQSLQKYKTYAFQTLYKTGVFRHLKHISLQYEQTVDTLVAHGADLFAQDDQVGHAAGKQM